jgi:starch synthase
MPSRFEPCGLSQLISFKYGTLPLVYATGGLEDTVKDLAPDAAKGNGFVFSDHSKAGLTAAFKRAEQLYKTKSAWDKAVARAMGAVFSWTKAAEKYDEMYRSVV